MLRFLLRAGRIAAALLGIVIGSAGVLGAVVGLEAMRVRGKARNHSDVLVPHAAGTFGGDNEGEPLHLAMLGDSLAVGVGADSAADTVGARLAVGLAAHLKRPVRLHSVAVVGAESRNLSEQIVALDETAPHVDIAIVIIGSNDVMGLDKISTATRDLYRAVRTLRRGGARVIVATCPDLGTVRMLFQPLRYAARRASRKLAVAQTIVTVHAGGRAVPLGDTLGPLFWRRPKRMFSADNFHPSPLGYARAAAVLFPSVLASAQREVRPEQAAGAAV
ncbi:SGNH/GDSL hydrolase family protein [Microbacterium sp. STN6]|uniref:SGNH/GDSL hydrolase family protein n=1 Tax=Microbacterium sp. STN6 TaxID=2995588 RepID=UPI0022609379|nr:SGNH/GDSL hydrolase family protein [Microbacterium sp. STN6]MCX7521552.1 SGNH/GDSL hydrolase family protein [Microbacterium sp. STN6]